MQPHLALLALLLAGDRPLPRAPDHRPPPRQGAEGAADAISAALARSAPGGPRADAATRPLLGAPYVVSPLGEGSGYDPDPRFRLDAFDCMTFAETAVALGSAASLDDARVALDDIRYSGPLDYEHRNHEVLSQWIPSNLAKGWVEDVVPAVAGPLAGVAVVEYGEARWESVARAGHSIPGVSRERLPTGRFSAGLVRAADVPAVASRIPVGTLAFVVRDDAPDRATRVTHVGLVVAGPDGARRVRHATSSAGVARVIEEPIARFLEREQRASAWRVSGLALLAVRDNRARVAALKAASPPAGAPASAPPAAPPTKM